MTKITEERTKEWRDKNREYWNAYQREYYRKQKARENKKKKEREIKKMPDIEETAKIFKDPVAARHFKWLMENRMKKKKKKGGAK